MKISLKSIYNWYRSGIRNPRYRWWIILGTLVYLLSPIDISPDMIPIVGQIDDFVILSLLLTEVSGLLFDAVKAKGSKTVAEDNNPQEKTIDVDAVSVD